MQSQTKVLEEQLGAQVWPYVGVTESVNGDTITIGVSNDGLGPAVFRPYAAWREDRPGNRQLRAGIGRSPGRSRRGLFAGQQTFCAPLPRGAEASELSDLLLRNSARKMLAAGFVGGRGSQAGCVLSARSERSAARAGCRRADEPELLKATFRNSLRIAAKPVRPAARRRRPATWRALQRAAISHTSAPRAARVRR